MANSMLEILSNIQLLIKSTNQEIKENEFYIFYKEAEIEKLVIKIEEHKKQIATLEKKSDNLSTEIIRSEKSLLVSSYCLNILNNYAVNLEQEKENTQREFSEWNSKYETVLQESREALLHMRSEYENKSPLYGKVKIIQDKKFNLEREIKTLKHEIDDQEKLNNQLESKRKQKFYNNIVTFSEAVLTYMKTKDMYNQCTALEKEEACLLKEFSELQRNENAKRITFCIPQPPVRLQMPKLQSSLCFSKGVVNSPYRGRADKTTPKQNIKPQITGLRQSTDNQAEILKESLYFRKSLQNIPKDFQNQNTQKENVGERRKALEENSDSEQKKIKIIDMKVFPSVKSILEEADQNKIQPNPFTYNNRNVLVNTAHLKNNQTKGQITSSNNIINQQNKSVFTLSPANMNFLSSNTLKERIVPKKRDSFSHSENQIFTSQNLWSQPSTDNLPNNHTGLTQEMYDFKLLLQNPNNKGLHAHRGFENEIRGNKERNLRDENLNKGDVHLVQKEDIFGHKNLFNDIPRREITAGAPPFKSMNPNSSTFSFGQSSDIMKNFDFQQSDVTFAESNEQFPFSANNSLMEEEEIINNESFNDNTGRNQLETFTFNFQQSASDKSDSQKDRLFKMYY